MPHTEPPLPAATLRFGPSLRFELQPSERRLLVDGQPAALGSRALDLLITLALQPGHLLTKDELLDSVWPGLVVEEANLQMQISNLRKLLGRALIATVPGRGYRFVAAGSELSVAPTPSPAAAVPAAPLRSTAHRLIGRDQDLAQLDGLLRGGACVTLVGTAGVGKTSLARAAAARWPGRSVWVDLAALTQGRQIAGALARALDLQLTGVDADAPAQLLAALRTQTLLLVLDNAEHLISTCAELATLLRPLAGLQLLVTSQTPLAVAGERLLRLGPLALPQANADLRVADVRDADARAADARAANPLAGDLGDGALALLVERITAADHRFVLTPAALPLLHAVCVQLDGLPLALEMAAARVPLLGVQGVCDALAQRFALLTRGHRDAPARHRTLHSALAWSHSLLSAAEQRLFRALGVFAGGFTLELAVALMVDAGETRWDVIDGLAALADRSLLVVGQGDPLRYGLLESVRAFALAQLAGAGEHHAMQQRHAAALCALFGRHAIGNAATQAVCLAEMENVRDAITWAGAHALDIAAQLTAQATLVTTFTVWRHEAGNWLLALAPLLAQAPDGAVPPQVQAAWWTERARTASMRRDASAGAAAQHAMALWRPLQQPHQLLRATVIWVRSITSANAELAAACTALQAQVAALPDLPLLEQLSVQGALSRAAVIRGDLAAVLAGREAERALAGQLGQVDPADAAESSIVTTLNGLGRHAEAAERGRALLARLDADGRGSNGNLPWTLVSLFSALVALGRLGEAGALLPQLFTTCRRHATSAHTPLLCRLAAAQQRFEAAALLLGYAHQRYASHALAFEPGEAADLERVLAAVSAALGVGQAQALVQQGRWLADDAAERLVSGHTP